MFSHPELMFLQLTERREEDQQRDRRRQLQAALRRTHPARGRRRVAAARADQPNEPRQPLQPTGSPNLPTGQPNPRAEEERRPQATTGPAGTLAGCGASAGQAR